MFHSLSEHHINYPNRVCVALFRATCDIQRLESRLNSGNGQRQRRPQELVNLSIPGSGQPY